MRALLLVLFAVLSGCLGGAAQDRPQDPEENLAYPASPAGVLRLALLGDTGTGGEEQLRVARALHQVCQARGCDAVLIAGDNIYPSGVENSTDAQFEEKFEIPYAQIQAPFYLVLGNHDNGGGIGSHPEMGDHQVRYSQRTDRLSDRWNMPSRNYRISWPEVDLFALDSGPEEVAWSSAWMPGSRGPMVEQWLAQEIPKSTARWKIAMAHHPYASNGEHGNAGAFDDIPSRGLPYRLMLERYMCGTMDLFVAGHDHHLAWMEPAPHCAGTELIITGASAKLSPKGRPPDLPVRFETFTNYGFAWVEFQGDVMTGAFYGADARQLFEQTVRRTAE